MASIIRGTTPTLQYTFNDVTVANITSAYLTIKVDNTAEHDIEKDLSSATVAQKSISWTLTQAETLSFGTNISVMINWKLQDGTRGASEKTKIMIDDNYKEDVI